MENDSFVLDPRLASDTYILTEWKLSRVLLMNDARYPWLILVPRRNGQSEILDLDSSDQHQLFTEITLASRIVRTCFTPDKLNIAALGNVVPQLHIHVIARYKQDFSWPLPVWGLGERESYTTTALSQRIQALNETLKTAYEHT